MLFHSTIFTQKGIAQYAPTGVKISLPLDRTVYQQTGTGNSKSATFLLAGQITGYYPASSGLIAEYQIESLDKMGAVLSVSQNWIVINYSATGFFNRQLTLGTGWYRITTRYGNFSKSIKVGVGEVIFAAGQSNAQGVEMSGSNGGIPNLGVNYDCINAVNENCFCLKTYPFPTFKQMIFSGTDLESKVAPNGKQNLWCYQAFGKRIVDNNTNTVIPVMFFNAGSGGTSMDNWKVSAENDNNTTRNPLAGAVKNCEYNNPNGGFPRWDSEGPEGQPYRGLKTSLNFYGSITGTRGVIWHQGESETVMRLNNSPDVADYQGKLQFVINKSRLDFNDNLSWAISRVSRIKPDNDVTIRTNADVRNDQTAVKNAGDISKTAWGAYYSDDIVDRLLDDTHFNSNGLLKLAELYATGTFTGNTAGTPQGGQILSLTPVASNISPSVSVTQSGSNVVITLNSSYSAYRWVKNEGKINSANSIPSQLNSSITVPNDGTDRWRCYALDSKGNVVISQEVALPVAGVTVLGTGGGSTVPQTEYNCPVGSYTAQNDVVNCDVIAGWAFKSNTSQSSGEVIIYVDDQKVDRVPANSFKGYTASNGTYVINYEGYNKYIQNASWKNGNIQQIRLFLCGASTPFFTSNLQCRIPYFLSTNNQSNLTNAGSSGGTGSFTVNSTNVAWSISGIPTWASINQTSGGNGNTGITVTFQANTGTSRSADLILSGNNGVSPQIITISQVGGTTTSTGCVINKVKVAYRGGDLNNGCCFDRLIGSKIQGSNDNSNWTDLYTFNTAGNGTLVEYTFGNSTSYSYVRFRGGSNSYGELSQLEFYNGNTLLTGTGFGTETYANALDNNPNTSWHGSNPGPQNIAGLQLSGCTGTVTPPTPTGCGSGTGLTANYFAGEELQGNPIQTLTQATVNIVGGDYQIIAGTSVAGHNVSARWEGQVEAPVSGSYTFNVRTDDGTRVWFDGVQVVNDWGYFGATDHNFTVSMNAGDKKSIKIEWKQAGGGYEAGFYWTYPNQGSQIVPACRLYPTGGTTGGGTTPPTPTNCAGGNFSGHLDGVNCSAVFGWCFENNNLGRTVQVDIFVDDVKVGTVDANQNRLDLGTAFQNPAAIPHGYTYSIPQNAAWKNGQPHNIRARPCGGTNDLANSPKSLTCNAGQSRVAVVSEENTESISVYPNPTTGKIKVVFVLQKEESVWLNLYDAQGKSLNIRDFEGKIGRNEVEYELDNHPTGAYFINFQSAEKREVLKVMKVN